MWEVSKIYLILAAVLIFVMTAISGRFIIPVLKRKKISQTEREEGPESHLKKTGTPTFGGLIFLPPLLLVTAVYTVLQGRPDLLLTLFFVALIAAIGFFDDYYKVHHKEGISAGRKTILLLIVCGLYVLAYCLWGQPVLVWPGSAGLVEVKGWGKVFYALFLLFYFYAVINAVNLTDGVDGLLSSVNMPVALTLTVSGLFLADRLGLAAAAAAVPVALGIIGAGAGFLIYNKHKAQVFMGDTGSLALGALLAAVAMLQGIPWILLPAGIIYVLEAGSVVIQVLYFRKTGGKRIFRMSPIHHHFELGGWSEGKVVFVFTSIATVGCLLGLILLLF